MEDRSCYTHNIRTAKCEEMTSEIVRVMVRLCLFTHRFHLPGLQGSYLGKSVFRKQLCPANTDSVLALPGPLCSMRLAIHGGLSELLIGRRIETNISDGIRH